MPCSTEAYEGLLHTKYSLDFDFRSTLISHHHDAASDTYCNESSIDTSPGCAWTSRFKRDMETFHFNPMIMHVIKKKEYHVNYHTNYTSSTGNDLKVDRPGVQPLWPVSGQRRGAGGRPPHRRVSSVAVNLVYRLLGEQSSYQ